MKVSELGEFGLIDLLARMIADAGVDRLAPDRPVIGIGDDAAAWYASPTLQLATIDTMVEEVHFMPQTATWEDIGWKALAVNLSDIAAMGGLPEYALIALNLTETTTVASVISLYEGIIAAARQFHVAIVGGNISRAAQTAITIALYGRATETGVLRRSAAMPGDVIAVTGHPGSAAGGLEILRQKPDIGLRGRQYLTNAFLRPVPRIREGQLLVAKGIRAAIDTSDGLMADLRHIAKASRVSARIFSHLLPLHEALREAFPVKALALALSGGEDYELLFTGRWEAIDAVRKETDCPVTIIGEIVAGEAGKVDIIDAAGDILQIEKPGFSHF